MIPVEPRDEPGEFEVKVRRKGLSAVDELVGRPPRWKRPGPRRSKVADREADIPPEAFPPYWRDVLPEMLVAYHRRCAYLALHIPHATGNPTVDHVLPKSYAWERVYEWSNYRLCAAIVNTKKGILRDLVDPFEVGDGWFSLNLMTFHVVLGGALPAAHEPQAVATLPLLNMRECVAARTAYVEDYRRGPDEGGISLSYLERRAPFVAAELRRQDQLARGDV